MQLRSINLRRAAIAPTALAAASLLAINVLATGCNGASADAAIDRYPPGHQQHIGNVSGTTLTGKPLSLSSYAGHVVVVNFWASNCSPCRAEQTTLDEVQKAMAPKGVKFVGIDEGDEASQAKTFLAEHPASYPSLFDPAGKLSLQFPGSEPETTPTTIVITKGGMIAARASGSIFYSQLAPLVQSVLQQSDAA